MIRILILSPYASLRAELHALVAEAADITVVGTVGGSEELEDLLPDTRPDILLWEGGDSDSESARIFRLLAGTDVGLIRLGEGPEELRQMLDGGVLAWGYLRREVEGVEVVGAIRAVAAGLVTLDPIFAAHLQLYAAAAASVASMPLPNRAGAAQTVHGLPPNPLTAREREVLQLMTQGLANKQIGGRLSISLHTVKFHVASILAKLGATSRTEAVTLGARQGLVIL